MELIELLDENGQLSGVIDRATAHKVGAWHKSVHVWVVNDRGDILLAKRSKNKSFFPSCWDCAFAGHIDLNENSLSCAIREGREEIGIALKPADFEHLITYKDRLTYKDQTCNQFAEVYLVRKNVDITKLKLQFEEVDELKWIDTQTFFEDIKNKKGNYLFHGEEEYDYLNKVLKKDIVVI